MRAPLKPQRTAHDNAMKSLAYNLDTEKSTILSSQDELVNDDGHQVPTEEELRTLPRVADQLP
jgi:hypothetical protein